MLYRVLPRDIFIISIEESTDKAPPSALYRVISTHNVNNIEIDLVKWRPIQTTSATTVVTVRSTSEFNHLSSTWAKLPQGQKLIVISPYPTIPGLKDFVKDKRKDADRNLVFLIMVSGKENLDRLPEMELTYSVLNNVIFFYYFCILLNTMT